MKTLTNNPSHRDSYNNNKAIACNEAKQEAKQIWVACHYQVQETINDEAE